MADNLNLAIHITADPAQAKAGLEAVRQAILQNYAATKEGVTAANAKLNEAQQHAQALAAALKADGVAGESFALWMAKARDNVRAAKDEVINQTQAMQGLRAAAQDNATSIAAATAAQKTYADAKRAATAAEVAAALARARDEAHWRLATVAQNDHSAALQRSATATAQAQQAANTFVSGLKREAETAGMARAELIRYEAAQLSLSNAQKRQVESLAKAIQGSDLDISRRILGVQAHGAIAAEIGKIRAAYAQLAASGKLTGAELSQAHDRMKAKVVELKESMNGSRTQMEKFFSLGSAAIWIAGVQQAVQVVKQMAGAFIEAQTAADKMRNTLAYAAGGKIAGAAEMEYLRATCSAAR